MIKPQINQLLKILNEEFTAHLIEPAGDVGLEQIFIELPNDNKGRVRQLELVILPDEDGICFLQYFIAIPIAIQSEKINDLSRLVLKINSKLPLVGFGLLEDNPLLYFRCVVPCPNQPLSDDIYVHTAHTILYIIDNFGPIIESLVNGETDYNNCIHQVETKF